MTDLEWRQSVDRSRIALEVAEQFAEGQATDAGREAASENAELATKVLFGALRVASIQ